MDTVILKSGWSQIINFRLSDLTKETKKSLSKKKQHTFFQISSNSKYIARFFYSSIGTRIDLLVNIEPSYYSLMDIATQRLQLLVNSRSSERYIDPDAMRTRRIWRG